MGRRRSSESRGYVRHGDYEFDDGGEIDRGEEEPILELPDVEDGLLDQPAFEFAHRLVTHMCPEGIRIAHNDSSRGASIREHFTQCPMCHRLLETTIEEMTDSPDFREALTQPNARQVIESLIGRDRVASLLDGT